MEINMSMKWALAICAALLLSCTQANAKVHREFRTRKLKIFAAKPWSVSLENEVGDVMGAYRYFTQPQVDAAVQSGELVPLCATCSYTISPKLPADRRYALPATIAFTETLAAEFFRQFHQPLMVDSAVRPATVQRSLLKWNRNAAPAYGARASSHERGTTIDVSKHLTKAQQRWMVERLLYYRALGRILVIEEHSCYHVFVRE